MTVNVKSLSTQANLATSQLPVDLPKIVDVTFKLDQGITTWSCSPDSFGDGDSSFEVKYRLSPDSTPGWSFSQITIEDPNTPPAWTFKYPNDEDADTYDHTGLMKVTGFSLAPTLISFFVSNYNHTTMPKAVSVKLTVSNSENVSYTSPDPQIILEPRPNR